MLICKEGLSMFEIGSNKKVLIIVPHQDDEINLMGGLLPLLVKMGLEVNVCYTTNGDFEIPGEVRLIEALRALQCLGINKRNVFFLGYPDGSNKLNHSLYKSVDAVVSRKGAYTYGCSEKQEYRMEKSGYHSLNTYSSFKDDLNCLIADIMPDIFFCIDLDAHHDHIMTSLAFEEVICDFINKNNTYRPLIYKGFAYATTYEGQPDFFKGLNLLPAFDNSRKESNELQKESCHSNQYLKWADRVRFPVLERCTVRTSFSNPLINAMFKHRSQSFSKRITRVINSDVVFWEKPLKNKRYMLFEAERISGKTTVYSEKTVDIQRCVDSEKTIRICKIILNNMFSYDNYYISNEISIEIDIYRYNYEQEVSYCFDRAGVYVIDGNLVIPKELDEFTLCIKDNENRVLDSVKVIRQNLFQKVLIYTNLSIFKLKCYIKRKVY